MHEQPLSEIEVFCNIFKVFTDTLDQFNASLMNKSIVYFFNILNRRVYLSPTKT